jgi:hypothetical protein
VTVYRFETAWEKAGCTHTEFTFRDAMDNFRSARDAIDPTLKREQTKFGVASLAHAWYVAVTTGEQLDADKARELFNELCRLAGTWEVGGAG